ncbi:efflux RND transporter periplasmic adaptor subunit [Opitutus sp. ER46]|uniref:efflux RND transporter periplasmic adaptor subunit n=1 Tax=Opitutus sp. ER46 TaxID=2161864 RepID=UPI000D300C39|nr:efflux RND transporter periplasmic adaptor subunit [Opitutus sp. ER46]PTX91676.1 hypothetical protein DB354_17565 [Opitutus sp. ER46]
MNVLSLTRRFAGSLLVLLSLTSALEAKIGALGRIMPAGDILNLPGTGDAVATVHVKEGEQVAAGALLVTFRSHDTATNEVAMAQLALREAEELGQMALEAQELRLEVGRRDYEYARARYERFVQLGGEKSSPQQVAERAHQMRNAELSYLAAQKEYARAKIDRDMKIERARNQLAIARDKLDRSTLCAPAALTVVKLGVVPGTVPSGVAVCLANLTEMQVSAEVFAGDLPKLKLGQPATITSTSLPAPIKGKVISIGRVISGRAKVAEVLIKLDETEVASRLLNLEVNVSIDE